jgi:hypothetical protein
MNKKKSPPSERIFYLIILALFFPTLPTWWANKAQITIPNGFWGDDVVSQFFAWIANLVISVWNTLSANDTLRAIVTAIMLGILGAMGTDLYKKYKATQKEEE